MLLYLSSFVLLFVAVASRPEAPQFNVVELARRLGIYSYLFALEETNSTDIVAKADGITVFIPTNEAFQRLPESTRNYWRKNPGYYQNLMRYHVVKGRFAFKDFVDETLYQTFSPSNLTGRFVNYTGYSNNVRSYTGVVIDVNNTDYKASNGIIHFVNDIVGHMQTGTLLQTVANMSELSKILNATSIADFKALSGKQPLTFFAPTNHAIAKLRKGVWTRLLKNKQKLNEVLQFHTASAGTWFSVGLTDGLIVETLNRNGNLTIHVNDKGIQINEARVQVADMAAVNGVIHTIDTVLLPPPVQNWLNGSA